MPTAAARHSRHNRRTNSVNVASQANIEHKHAYSDCAHVLFSGTSREVFDQNEFIPVLALFGGRRCVRVRSAPAVIPGNPQAAGPPPSRCEPLPRSHRMFRSR